MITSTSRNPGATARQPASHIQERAQAAAAMHCKCTLYIRYECTAAARHWPTIIVGVEAGGSRLRSGDADADADWAVPSWRWWARNGSRADRDRAPATRHLGGDWLDWGGEAWESSPAGGAPQRARTPPAAAPARAGRATRGGRSGEKGREGKGWADLGTGGWSRARGGGMGYGEPPWTFRGRAVYQLQLLRAADARAAVPEELRLVEAFGWCLGGFFLAEYDESPVGPMQELVTLGGVVWEPPTSCAWASRVHVCHDEARAHGVAHVGLPSRHAAFSRRACTREPVSVTVRERPARGTAHRLLAPWRRLRGRAYDRSNGHGGADPADVEVHQQRLPEVATFHRVPPKRTGLAAGPRIRMSLPSFSGLTSACPDMLRYAVRLSANVRPARPARVELPAMDAAAPDGASAPARRALAGRPLVALVFEDMEMVCGRPAVVSRVAAHGLEGAGSLGAAAA